MRLRFRSAAVLAALLVSGLPVAASGTPLLATEMLDLVDPMIGTTGSGFVFPGPAAPFGMVQLSPDTEGPTAYTGYAYHDKFIRGFSHVHTQSMGVWEGGEVPLMPTVGDPVTDVKAYQAPFVHAQESASVGAYDVTLGNGVAVELTAGMRTGLHRYTFPAGERGNVVIDAGRNVGEAEPIGPDGQNDPGRIPAEVEILDDGTVVGTANAGATGTREYTVHFAIRTSEPADSFGTFASRGAPVIEGSRTVAGRGAGAVLSFVPGVSPRTVVVAVGISFVDRAGALANLAADPHASTFAFEALKEQTRAAWRDALSTITVTGGTPDERVSFATALYHSQHHPNVFNDADGRYRGMDRQVHRIGATGDPMPAGSDYYANFSLWDTYRTQMPLLSWIQPQRVTDMMRSLHAATEQGGRLPHWGWMDRYADFMNGHPALPAIADAFCRGLIPQDLADGLYADARRLALMQPRDPVYASKGYVPADHNGGSFGSGASSTLEYAANDFSLALVADALGEGADRDALVAQSGNWRNVFDPDTRFMRPRNGNGAFVGNPYVPGGPYMPELPNGWREGTGWQYTWLVPHDPAGLFAAMGAPPQPGEALVQQRLDEFFSLPGLLAAPHATAEFQQKLTFYGVVYAGNQYAPSNEHDLQAPWLYAFTSQPWKTDAAVRAYRTLYRPTPDGLPGNDDLGTMSAWFIWSAMGLYPVQAGAPVYTLTVPLFDEVRVQPAGGSSETRIVSTGVRAPFLTRAAVNGSEHHARSVTHEEIAGGLLELSSAPSPSLTQVAPPPSASTHALESFGCRV